MSREIRYHDLAHKSTNIDAVASTLEHWTVYVVSEARTHWPTTSILHILMKVSNDGNWEGYKVNMHSSSVTTWHVTPDTVGYMFDVRSSDHVDRVAEVVKRDVEAWRARAYKRRKLALLEEEILSHLDTSNSESMSVQDLDGICKRIDVAHGRQVKPDKDPLVGEIQQWFQNKHQGFSPPAQSDGVRWYPTDDILRAVQQMYDDQAAPEEV
jgi:hypothetical protein